MDSFQRQQIIKFFKLPFNKNNSRSKRYLEVNFHYWRTVSFKILNYNDNDIFQETIEYLQKCKNDDGGYSCFPSYASTTFNTFFACSIYFSLNIDFYHEKTVDFVMSCYKNGIFYERAMFDGFEEEDNRFIAACLITLSLLDCDKRKSDELILSDQAISILEKKGFDKQKTIQYLIQSQNYDGGFGCIPNVESHCGQIYCCLISLKILNSLHRIDQYTLIKFLQKRQCESGGLNGRPYKLEDSCYSFWTAVSLDILNSIDSIDISKLKSFIYSCFNINGYSYRPDSSVDGFHTMYSLLGIKILEKNESYRKFLHFGVFK